MLAGPAEPPPPPGATATSRRPRSGSPLAHHLGGLLAAGAVGIGVLATVGTAAWVSCGVRAETRAGHDTIEAPAARADPARRAAGEWQWSLAVEDAGVRRIERERWQLAGDGATLSGSYVREIFALSTDGEPFACNQALAYRLRAVYRVTGLVDGDTVHLEETAYDVTPSPCERGFRLIGSYQGTLAGGALVLRWNGGQQTLERPPPDRPPPIAASAAIAEVTPTATPTPAVAPAAVAATGAAPIAPGPAAIAAHEAAAPPATLGPQAPATVPGAWRWSNHGVDPSGHTRVETEEWQLTEDRLGALSGTIVRTVAVFDEDGATFACNGDSHYAYRDRYTVRGRRDGEHLTLREVEVEPEDDPCIDADLVRHLDTAEGTMLGEYLELEWRGKRRQVLSRP